MGSHTSSSPWEPGSSSRERSTTWHHGHRWAVVDLSVAMLARARRRLGDGVLYVRADVERLPFVTGAFGSLHSASGFHLFPDIDGAAVEVGRVVASGGDAVVTSWASNRRRLPEWWMTTLARRGYVNQPVAPERIEAALEAGGFQTTSSSLSGSNLVWHGRRQAPPPPT